jgi:patatin-like phospholipase/acyl hydrolase
VLTIDGGGVRGIVPLTILGKLAIHMDDAGVKKPSECFDLIMGTSTGGLLAVLLGVLQLTITESIVIYKKLSTLTFGRAASKEPESTEQNANHFEALLKAEIKRIVNEKAELLQLAPGTNLDEIKLSDMPPRSGDNPRPRVVIVGKKGNDDSAFYFTNFKCAPGRNYKQDEMLYKALRATSTGPFFIDPIEIGKSPYSHPFLSQLTSFEVFQS